jgi:hypothetical protein
MYRLLAALGESKERRAQRGPMKHAKPTLSATAPNRVWTWDITKLRGPLPGVVYCLYVVLDLFSRMTVGWLLAERESAVLAEQLFAEAVARHSVEPGALTVHADRGAAMRSEGLAQRLGSLGVEHSSHLLTYSSNASTTSPLAGRLPSTRRTPPIPSAFRTERPSCADRPPRSSSIRCPSRSSRPTIRCPIACAPSSSTRCPHRILTQPVSDALAFSASRGSGLPALRMRDEPLIPSSRESKLRCPASPPRGRLNTTRS